MCLIVVMIASLIASAASAADGWREDIYLGLKFAVSFPAPPKIEEMEYASVRGTAVGARVYSLEQDNKIYKMTVADFSGTGLDEIASVYYQRRLYQIQGTVLAVNADPVSRDTIRFQHSFRFTDFAYQ